MSAALLLVDLQADFLRDPRLEPAAGEIVARAGALLAGFREAGLPVVHVHTLVGDRPQDHEPMPHWTRAGTELCVRGTNGAKPPPPLRPRGGEPAFAKRFYSAFGVEELSAELSRAGAERLVIAGIHLHACVRATAVDAYERGFEVVVAADATGSRERLHAAATRSWLQARGASFASVAEILGDPSRPAPEPARVASAGLDEVLGAAGAAAVERRSLDDSELAATMARVAAAVAADCERLAATICGSTGKPIRFCRAEVTRAARLFEIASQLPPALSADTGEAEVRRPPLGTVAQITPWNNPLAIPAGKLAPALRYGNAVAWKPAPLAGETSRRLVELLVEAGVPHALVALIEGGAATGEALLAHHGIDAATVTGSSPTGFAAQAICGERRLPLQAELGGNNAAIVWDSGDLDEVAEQIATAGWRCAGQRCTANRRVIVEAGRAAELAELIADFARRMPDGDPFDSTVEIGPMASADAATRVRRCIDRARASFEVREPRSSLASERHVSPALVICPEPRAEIVRHETFGPVVVLQPAEDFEQALALANDVPEGLVMSLFTSSDDHRERFLAEARAGVLKLGRATADVGVETPFGGWKASGIGPPEHGASNIEFYTRRQAIYR